MTQDSTSIRELRWDLLHRFRMIEIVALWEGRITTRHLVNAFDISRQQASKDISQYMTLVPSNIEHDPGLRGYAPTGSFRPRFTQGTADEYLQLLHAAYNPETGLPLLAGGAAITQTMSVPGRAVSPQLIRPLVQACNQAKKIQIRYMSLNSQSAEDRVISPHTLVHNGYRWHVRAYCEKRQRYADFVLSRFLGAPKLLSRAEATKVEDEAWNKVVKVAITADSRLDSFRRKIIEHDYGMKQGTLLLSTRGALVQYLLQLMRVDEANPEKAPIEQQIVVANFDELEPFLFSSRLHE